MFFFLKKKLIFQEFDRIYEHTSIFCPASKMSINEDVTTQVDDIDSNAQKVADKVQIKKTVKSN